MMLGIPNFQPALGYTPENVANKQTTLSASATEYPNADAVIAAIDAIPTFDPASNQTITGAWGFTDNLTKNSVEVATVDDVANAVLGLFDDRGTYNASSNTFPSTGGSGASGAILKGDVWTVSAAGTLGGAAVTAGDTVRALTDTPGQTASNWAIAETNIGYVPEPAIAVGTTSQYWRGDKTWRDFFTDVRAATLAGLSVASSAAITASSTALEAFGQLQAQVTARLSKSSVVDYYIDATTGAIVAETNDTTVTLISISTQVVIATSAILTPNGDYLSEYKNIAITVEIYTNSQWANSGFFYLTSLDGGIGVTAGLRDDTKVITQSGSLYLCAAPSASGGLHSASPAVTSAQCRLHIRAIKVT